MGEELDEVLAAGDADAVRQFLLKLPQPRNPAIPGVYALITAADELAYIGQSGNVYRRLCNHRLVDYQRPIIIHCEAESERLDLEKSLIRLLRPRLNKVHKA